MTDTNKWFFVNHDAPYFDFEKSLYWIPDVGNTSVDIRLTFVVDDHICYYSISLHNDNGNTRDWEEHYVPWAVGLEMLRKDGSTIPEELIEAKEKE